MPKDFYVYLHKKSSNGDVFYVGKGSGNRAWRFNQRSKLWKNIVKKHGVTVEIFESSIQEWYAFELEINLIAYYGRMQLGEGKLINFTDGGDGTSGWVPSEETKIKMSIAQNEKSVSDKKRAAMIGRKKPAWHSKKIGDAQKGKIISAETRSKLSASLKGRKTSEETRQKLIFAQNKPETIQKRKDNLIGKKHTQEHKDAISASLRGRVFLQESRDKSSMSQKNKPKSEDAKQKMREGWAKRKATLAMASNQCETI
jgi:hypothetical protein